MMPVGHIYISNNSTSPETLFGFGTWKSITGRAIVGVDPNDSDFNEAGNTGGSKTVTLNIDQIPAHAHTQQGTLNTSTTPPHTHSVQLPGKAGGDGFLTMNDGYGTGRTVSSGAGGSHSHTVELSGDTSSTGGGQAHSNMMPYETKYVWERTA